MTTMARSLPTAPRNHPFSVRQAGLLPENAVCDGSPQPTGGRDIPVAMPTSRDKSWPTTLRMVDEKENERFPDLQYSLLATSDHVKHTAPIASRIPVCLNRIFNTSLLKALDTPVIKVIARALPLHYP